MLKIFFRCLSIKTRFALIVGQLILGFSLFGLVAFEAMNTVNLNSPIYQRIIQGKDLIADVLPPPEYIIESYLVVLQLSQSQSQNQQERQVLLDRFNVLKADYEARHQYWLQQELTGELRTALVQTSYQYATTFYQVAEQVFLPALKAQQTEQMLAGLAKIQAAYQQHRAAIDAVVKLAGERNQQDDGLARTSRQQYQMLLLVIFLASLTLTLIFVVLVIRGVLRSLSGIQEIAAAITEGDLSSKIDVQSEDEIGMALKAINTMQASIKLFAESLQALTALHAQGQVKERLAVKGFQGIYRTMAEQVDELIQSALVHKSSNSLN